MNTDSSRKCNYKLKGLSNAGGGGRMKRREGKWQHNPEREGEGREGEKGKWHTNPEREGGGREGEKGK